MPLLTTCSGVSASWMRGDGACQGLENQLMLTLVLVRELSNKGEGTGLARSSGGALGGLGSQIGGGHGKTTIGGRRRRRRAFAGHESSGGETRYEVTVRFDDGCTTPTPEAQAPQLRSGDRVRFANGHLMSI